MSLSKPNLKYTYSEKQNPLLVVENHVFNKHITRSNGKYFCLYLIVTFIFVIINKGEIYLRCTEFSSIKDKKRIHTCQSTCTTRADRLIKQPTEHNHETKHTADSIELNQNLKYQIYLIFLLNYSYEYMLLIWRDRVRIYIYVE